MLMMMWMLSCLCPSVPIRIITTLLFQAYTINWVIMLMNLYDGVMLVLMTWYIDDNITTICDDVAISIVCMSDTRINNVLSQNDTNDNNTSTPPSFLLSTAVAYPCIRHKYST